MLAFLEIKPGTSSFVHYMYFVSPGGQERTFLYSQAAVALCSKYLATSLVEYFNSHVSVHSGILHKL